MMKIVKIRAYYIVIDGDESLMMYFVYFIRIIFTKRHQQLNYANCRIFQNKLVVNREGREERNSPEDYDVAGRSKFRQI